MERVQRKNQRQDSAQDTRPVQHKADAGSSASSASGESESSESESSEGGGGDAGAGAWEADAGLMSAMGLGGDAAGAAPGAAGAAAAGGAAAGASAAPGASGASANAGAGASIAGGAPATGASAASAASASSSPKKAGESEEEEKEESEEEERKRKATDPTGADAGGGAAAAAGAVQHQTTLGGEPLGSPSVHETAASGVSGSASSLPHLDTIQHSFGDHDVSGVAAHTGGAAASANASMGSEAYASGNSVAFGSSSPSLHTAAHEAAHVVQQRSGISLKGGVGESGDTHEQHADAVADRVVQGKSASDLLDQYGGGGASGGAGVQHQLVQFDIKADLRKAMKGWGTDEAAIFARLTRASIPELQSVIADAKLMKELKDDLSKSEMARALDLMNAPLAEKLKLAISGWFNDNDYVRRSLERATPADLAAVAGDAALVEKLISTLGSKVLKQTMDKLQLPLTRKLEWAISGWGTDEEYIYQSISAASVGDVTALAGNAALLTKIDGDCSKAEQAHYRALMARKIYPGGSADLAFSLLQHDSDKIQDARLEEYGAIEEQRTLCDAVILATTDGKRGQRAFHTYWQVLITSAPAVAATTNGGSGGAATTAQGAKDWPLNVLQAIHRQLKLLPDQDTRAGVWNQLSLTNDPLLISRAAYGGGNFTVGANASPGTPGTGSAGGYFVRLSADAAASAPSITVDEGPRFKATDSLDVGAGADKETVTVSSIAGNVYTLGAPTTKAHATGDLVSPGDGSGRRGINWLDATVRHEIAHSLDGGGCDTSGFYSKGDWVLGDGDAGFDAWAAAMGPAAWTRSDAAAISDTDKGKIKEKIVEYVTGRKGSLFAGLAGDPTHPIMACLGQNVGVIQAAETCLALGDQFYNSPASLYAANGKRFTISWWYRRFQHHNEAVVSQRVANYGLYSPTEFFAEAYTVFYEEAGRPGVTDADYGRLIRNSDWRQWLRDNCHNRGQAPAGTGAATTPGTPSPSPDPTAGAKPTGGRTGKASGNPGM